MCPGVQSSISRYEFDLQNNMKVQTFPFEKMCTKTYFKIEVTKDIRKWPVAVVSIHVPLINSVFMAVYV